jgi:hypothetical protein
VADAVETFGQNVDEESADELVCGKCHLLVSIPEAPSPSLPRSRRDRMHGDHTPRNVHPAQNSERRPVGKRAVGERFELGAGFDLNGAGKAGGPAPRASAVTHGHTFGSRYIGPASRGM